MKHTGCSVISEPWEHIFPPQIFQVLLFPSKPPHSSPLILRIDTL